MGVLVPDLRDTVASTKPVRSRAMRRSSQEASASKDHPMTLSRFQARYSGQTYTRTCSTAACSGTTKAMSGRCHTCAARLRRFGHELQTLLQPLNSTSSFAAWRRPEDA